MGCTELHARQPQACAGQVSAGSLGRAALGRARDFPVARRMLLTKGLRLDACWGRTGGSRCSTKLVDTKVTGLISLFTLFELAG